MSMNLVPSNEGAERAILGSILLDDACLPQASHTLKVDDFSLESHRRIFRSMIALSDSAQPIDFITLSEQLRPKELKAVGGAAYLTSLTDGLPHVGNIEHYVRIVQNKALLRRLAHQAEGLRLAACNPDADPADIVEQLSEIAHSTCNAGIGTKRIRTLADVPDVFSLDTADISYIVPELVPRGSLILLSGEPGIGKSYLVLKLLVCCAFGIEFLGRMCERTRCLLLDRENPLTLIRSRLETLASGPVPGLSVWGGWLSEPPPTIGDARLFAITESERPLMIFDSLSRAE